MADDAATQILRIVHLDNLGVCLARGGLHAPNNTPEDGLEYRSIHNVEVQTQRQQTPIPCGPGGTIHDYVPFYFGPLSPMMLNLKTGRVAGYEDGQESLVYLVSTAEAVRDSGTGFVFCDGHGIARFTAWFDHLDDLDEIDWDVVGARYWADTVEDMDRQRRKQAEFLVHWFCDWSLIGEIVAFDKDHRTEVERLIAESGSDGPPVRVCREWYYW